MIHNLGQYQLEIFVSCRLNSICYICVINLFVRHQTIWENTIQEILTWAIKACEVIIQRGLWDRTNTSRGQYNKEELHMCVMNTEDNAQSFGNRFHSLTKSGYQASLTCKSWLYAWFLLMFCLTSICGDLRG